MNTTKEPNDAQLSLKSVEELAQPGPLPPARIALGEGDSTWDKFSRDQMHAYGLQERAAERERLAQRCEQVAAHDIHMSPNEVARYLAGVCRGRVRRSAE